MNRFAALAVPFALLLAACEDTAEIEAETAEQGGEAAGDVLGGTINDDMIPLEEIRSQSPPARRSSDSNSGDDE